ncbi:pyocin knob domain-containing S74 family peptidase [Achromobacter xylosoxidans]|uniref:pyocin knob domain-containing S74 family peptidase n=1 Tax=Alcaligenes xylosoxydans xylosoxydans TaxID=85698 RepID=UPI001F13676F|nr:pyocin knob domain-containing S74 family peptidase [Achromobacter xylosoxidans]
MANMQTIQVGKTDNDKTGDPLRVAMQKVNANFATTQAGLDSVGNASPIGAGVDLNTLTRPGRYHQATNANAQSGSNYPLANAGLLEVAASPDGLFVYQEFTQYRSGAYSRRFWRSFYGGTWAAWQELTALSQKGAANGLATLDAGGKVPAAQIPVAYSAVLPTSAHDLNDCVTPGSFYQTTIAGAAAGANYPVANVGFLEVTATGTPIVQVYTTRTNVVTAMQRFWRVRVSATTWSAWKELADTTTVVSYAGALATEQDLDNYTQRGVWMVGTSAIAAGGANFPVSQSGYLVVMSGSPQGGPAMTSGVCQVYYAGNGNKVYNRSLIGGSWSPWVASVDSAQLGSPGGVATLDGSGKIPQAQVPGVNARQLGAAEDLNACVTPGDYSQNTNAAAAAGSNYPTPLAGLLSVKFGTGSNNAVYQEYTTYTLANPRKFIRNRFLSAGVATWGAWFELARADQAVTHVYLGAATDANTLVADNTFYTWSNATPMSGANWPPSAAVNAGYMNVYWLAAGIVCQEVSVLFSGQKPRRYVRHGNATGGSWQPWRVEGSWSNAVQMPTADCGDIHVDGAGWYRWNGAAYARFDANIAQDLTFDSTNWKVRGATGFGPNAGGAFQSLSGTANLNVVPGTAAAGGRLNVWQDNGANASVLALQCFPSGAYVTSGRTGSGTYQPLIFEVAGYDCGRVNTAATWVLGAEYNRNYLVRQAINFEGGGSRFGTLYSPRIDHTSAIVFTNAAGGLVGTIQTSPSATSYNTTSDYRVKYDVEDMDGAWALRSVLKMRPRTFKMVMDDSAHDGFIAHELQEVAPLAVSGEKDAVMSDVHGGAPRMKLQGVDSSKLVARMVCAMQEMNRRIEELASRIERPQGESGAADSPRQTEGK